MSKKLKQPRVLLYDIETSPNLAYVWGKWEQDVIAYQEEWQMLSFAYKWLGEKEVKCVIRKGSSDKSLLVALHAVFSEADIVVAHNGDAFDQKKAMARMLYHGLTPPKTIVSVDTKKVAKKYFNFNSNSLNDLGQFLNLGTKAKHPGFEMWLGCMSGDKKSWALMINYNKQDVVLLEKVYKAFLPWMQNHPNLRLFNGIKDQGCPICGGTNVHKRGVQVSNKMIKQRYQCQDDGHWFTGSLKASKKVL